MDMKHPIKLDALVTKQQGDRAIAGSRLKVADWVVDGQAWEQPLPFRISMPSFVGVAQYTLIYRVLGVLFTASWYI